MPARLATAALGVWLMVAPAALDAGARQTVSMQVIGPLVAALGVAAASPVLDGLRWPLLPLAGWLITAPWFLGGQTSAVVNSVIVGVLVAALACVRRPTTRRYGGGWRPVAALLRRPARETGVGHG
jgi:hypothetical protein